MKTELQREADIQFWHRFFSHRDPSVIPNVTLKEAGDRASNWYTGLVGCLRPDDLKTVRRAPHTQGPDMLEALIDECAFEDSIAEIHPDGAPEGYLDDDDVQETYDDEMAAHYEIARDLWNKYRAEPHGPKPEQGLVTVTLDQEDRIELRMILHSRGGSALKVKLQAAYDTLLAARTIA